MAKKAKVAAERLCAECRADISHRHARAVFCEACAKKHYTAAIKRYQEQYRMKRRCIDCGADISHRGSRSTRCEKCARIHRLNLQRSFSQPEAFAEELPPIEIVCNDRCKKCIYYCDNTHSYDYIIIEHHSRSYVEGQPTKVRPISECNKFNERPGNLTEWQKIKCELVYKAKTPGAVEDHSIHAPGFMSER